MQPAGSTPAITLGEHTFSVAHSSTAGGSLLFSVNTDKTGSLEYILQQQQQQRRPEKDPFTPHIPPVSSSLTISIGSTNFLTARIKMAAQNRILESGRTDNTSTPDYRAASAKNIWQANGEDLITVLHEHLVPHLLHLSGKLCRIAARLAKGGSKNSLEKSVEAMFNLRELIQKVVQINSDVLSTLVIGIGGPALFIYSKHNYKFKQILEVVGGKGDVPAFLYFTDLAPLAKMGVANKNKGRDTLQALTKLLQRLELCCKNNNLAVLIEMKPPEEESCEAEPSNGQQVSSSAVATLPQKRRKKVPEKWVKLHNCLKQSMANFRRISGDWFQLNNRQSWNAVPASFTAPPTLSASSISLQQFALECLANKHKSGPSAPGQVAVAFFGPSIKQFFKQVRALTQTQAYRADDGDGALTIAPRLANLIIADILKVTAGFLCLCLMCFTS